MAPAREALHVEVKAEAQNSCRSLGRRSWASISVAQMLSECFSVLPSVHGGKSEHTRHRPPGAARPAAASRLSCSPLTQASPSAALLGIFQKKFLLSLFYTSLPLPKKLSEGVFSGRLHPWPPHAQLPQARCRAPRFSMCLQV